MFRFDASTEALAEAVITYAIERTRLDPPPLDGPRSAAELRAAVGSTITEQGIGGLEALRLFADVLAPASISVDHPRYLAFVGTAPTEAAILFDLVVGASSLYGGSWLEGAGAVFAENEALRWLADLAGLPPTAGGVFVAGGSAGNLSARVAARHHARMVRPELAERRLTVIASSGAHSSITSASKVMDGDVVKVSTATGRLTGGELEQAVADLAPAALDRVYAVVATAGTTNEGIIDDLAGIAEVCGAHGWWLHVDAAYGGAALAAPSARPRFAGIEHADSFVVDPHKWLFAPYDCAALLYRDPAIARAAHTQHAAYLDVLTGGGDWNPSDYAYHLTRRVRGLPFWFSLATHGTAAYGDAIEATLALTVEVGELIRATPFVELVIEPSLSVVLFRRLGWGPDDYASWSDAVLSSGLTLTVPTAHAGETCLRFCFVNPRTTLDDVRMIIDSLA